ncbi:hypothetical protein COO91_02995 [Nostoc flagelliforme CCNUN1]|uniref:Uncharacterized protein n=1 Tax=Nostoc flagelliforme CCNUN1 TaxID=2038116 RepID=A0A2K8SP24_9NOSO|nr:hypothetical protein [Nostoc flagelliforme]AUB37063.1 hypothetical protein COO91_02995 [Nostoc flagelliforme CCNUN1]
MNIADLTEFKELSFEEAENVSGRGTRFLVLVKLAPPDSIYLFIYLVVVQILWTVTYKKTLIKRQMNVL